MKLRSAILLFFLAAAALAADPVTVYAVPNTHGTIGGWLVDMDTELNYTVNNYLAHLDRVAKDPEYRFAFSEVPNVMSFMRVALERVGELKQRIKEGRVEFSNGFFVEPTISLSGGEALVRMGVLGLDWYQQVFGLRPRHCWMIDIVGAHRQLPQVVAGLGMDALFFCRNNPTNKNAFWWVAPDGTRQLTVTDIRYAEMRPIFVAEKPFTDKEYADVAERVELKRRYSASASSVLTLAGAQDYSLPPLRESFPSEFLAGWKTRHPDINFRFSIPSNYVDALRAEIKSGKTTLAEYSGDTAQSWNAFWINMPQVKQAYRHSEQLLAASELFSTAASLKRKTAYPSQDFYNSWVQMLLNMDRNTLWGAAGGMVFKDPNHWDAFDRFGSVDKQAGESLDRSLAKLGGKGSGITLANPLNWRRDDPVRVSLPAGKRPAGAPCQMLENGEAICRPELPPVGIHPLALVKGAVSASTKVVPAESYETTHYLVRIDSATGALVSLKSKETGREVLGGPANVLMVESVAGKVSTPGDYMIARPGRKLVATSSSEKPRIDVSTGPLFTLIRATSNLYGGSKLERSIILYKDYPRVDFETVLDWQGSDVLVTVDFPLAGQVVERTRGIPYGFATLDPRHPKPPIDYYLQADQRQYGYSEAMMPAVRWSDYRFADGSGVALLDRGLTSHEFNPDTITLGLMNAQKAYRVLPNEIMLGHGRQRFQYALIPHSGHWRDAAIPRRAWEFNEGVLAHVGAQAGQAESFLETSPNVIVEAVRRVDSDIEVRLAEWSGVEGEAWVELKLPHSDARITNMMGEKARPLPAGDRSTFKIRPQQIVTLRFATSPAVAKTTAIRDWEPLVPPAKRAGLRLRLTEKGHPPRVY
ncbi:MAG: glycoside hydrolase family 38 C-terminal domain-containing protein [Bryobacteraceae bacterium]